MTNTTKQTAGVSSLVAVPVSVAISFLTSTATVEVKAERNERDITAVGASIRENRDQSIRNEERLKGISKTQEKNEGTLKELQRTQTQLKALLEKIEKNTREQ